MFAFTSLRHYCVHAIIAAAHSPVVLFVEEKENGQRKLCVEQMGKDPGRI